MNFISLFLSNFTEGWSKWARVSVDLLFGLVLLLLLLMSAAPSPSY